MIDTTPSGTLVQVPVAPPTGSIGPGVSVGDRVAVRVISRWKSGIVWLAAGALPGLTGLYTWLTSSGVLAFKHHPIALWLLVTALGLLIAFLRTRNNTVVG